jgi:hypothetical protein
MTFPLNIAGRNINILSWDTCLGLHVVFLCTVKRVFCQLLTVHKAFEIACNNFNQTREFHVSVCVCVCGRTVVHSMFFIIYKLRCSVKDPSHT